MFYVRNVFSCKKQVLRVRNMCFYVRTMFLCKNYVLMYKKQVHARLRLDPRGARAEARLVELTRGLRELRLELAPDLKYARNMFLCKKYVFLLRKKQVLRRS